jgi:hypothetical protein
MFSATNAGNPSPPSVTLLIVLENMTACSLLRLYVMNLLLFTYLPLYIETDFLLRKNYLTCT